MSTLWYVTVAATALSITGLTYLCSKMSKDKLCDLSTKLGYFIVAQIIFTNIYLWVVQNSWTLQNNLPLSLCRASIILSAFALITKKDSLVIWASYLGISGGLQSILTPDLSYGLSAYTLFDYYFVHTILIFIPILLIYLLGIKLDKSSSIKAFIYGNAMLLLIFPINFLINANYMYLRIKPEVNNPLLIGNWPWYIIGFEIAGIVHIAIMDVIFRIVPNYCKKRQ
jgi:hypothetical integral membrane protein (TIGR02206 family)